MTIPKNGKHNDYLHYAEQSLKMARIATDQESRVIQREMAAEWLKLSDAVIAGTSKTD